jgi:hypothetical protein
MAFATSCEMQDAEIGTEAWLGLSASLTLSVCLQELHWAEVSAGSLRMSLTSRP